MSNTRLQNALHPVTSHIWSWSIFSDEKQLNFNGHIVSLAQGLAIIDPPSGDMDLIHAIQEIGMPRLVIITNRDHERESQWFKQQLDIPVMVHEADAPLLLDPPDKTFGGGDTLMDEIRVVHLPSQKSPGESALYLEHQHVLILGDALIGRPAGSVCMLPEDKFQEPDKARAALKRLLSDDLHYNTLLLGDGQSILEHGKQVIERFLQS